MSGFYQRCMRLLKKQNEEEEGQTVNINGLNVQRHSNAVITSKYTVFNFLFLNLYEQFHKTSNIYFLFIGILQTIPYFSSTNGIPTVALPLSIVLIANAIKDAYEDWKRHVSDKVENHKICYVIPAEDGEEIENVDFQSNGFFGKVKNWFKRKSKKKIDVVEDNRTKIDSGNGAIWEDNNYSSDERGSGEFHEDRYFYNYEAEEQCEFIEGTIQKQWKNIEVGDIILCNKSDFFCADILLLGTSDKNGIAFVETSSLDGETNLKVKQTNGYIMNLLGFDRAEAIERVKKLKGFIISDMPNKELSTMYGTIYLVKQADANLNKIQFSGNFKPSIDGHTSEINSGLEGEGKVVEDMISINVNSRNEKKGKRKRKKEQKESYTNRITMHNSMNYKKIPFDAKQFLLRGCKLKNTEWIIGIVIYTGKKTKIQMNSTESIRKTSKLERLTNKMTVIIWVIQMTICLISAVYNVAILYTSKRNDFAYLPFALEKRKPLIVVGIISFFSWMVITGNLVPISLVVTMSFVKVIQAYFISCDETMIHKVCTNPCEGMEESKRKSMVDNEKKSLFKRRISDAKHSFENMEAAGELISNVKKKGEKGKEGSSLSKGKVVSKTALEKKEESVNITSKEMVEVNDDNTGGIKKEKQPKNKTYVKHDISVNTFSFMEKRRDSTFASFMEEKEKNYIYFNAVPRTSSLIEELGQIEYIFSDKTGTLTCNFMEFRKCAINGISYGKGLTEIKRNILKKKNVKVPPEPVLPSHMKTPHVNIVDEDLVSHLKNINHFNHAHLMYFFIHLAINHAVICEKNENGEDTYASSSPDEEAFVYAAKHLGIQFLYRRDGKYGIKIFGKVYEIETLAAVEFTSQRKMSSIVCRIPCFSCGREFRKDIVESNKSSDAETGIVESTVKTEKDNKSTWNDALHSSIFLNDPIKESDSMNTNGRSVNENSTYRNREQLENLQECEKIHTPSEQGYMEEDNNDNKQKREKSRKEKGKKNVIYSKQELIKGETKKKIKKISIDGDSPLIESMNSKWQIKNKKKKKIKRDEELKSNNLKQKKKKHESARHLREKEITNDCSETYGDNEMGRGTISVCSNPSKHSKIIIFCKGAGSVILKKLEKTTEIDKLTVKHMETYADEGLRTLCIAKREISEEEFAKWYEVYKTASCSVKDRDEQIEMAADMIENNLTLQGITGIEDKLQEGVSSTIEDLRIAGIHIWMLTGDKIETAINIGIAANLIDHYAEQFVYTEDLIFDEEKLMRKLNEDILKIEKALDIPHYEFETQSEDEEATDKNSNKMNNKKTENEKEEGRNNGKDTSRNEYTGQSEKGNRRKKCKLWNKPKPLSLDRDKFTSIMNYTNHVLIIDGTVIDILLTEKFERQFFYLADKCVSVVCGRISPYQKGAIVSAANRLLKKITLAIGDGANDRNMINQANVGIGIRGLEGVQAFNASDYGIGQFRFLKTLLLVHGRLSYRRISKLVVYMFYKNIVLILPLFFFGAISLYSGQKFYYEFLMQTYNVFFTSIPVIIYAILDQDIDIKLSLVKPVLYRLGIYHYYFNVKIFVAWILNSVFHSLVVYMLPLYFLSYHNIPNTDGTPYDLWEVGCATFFLTVLVVNLKMLLESYYLNALPIIGVALSILCFVILSVTFSFMRLGSSQMLGAAAYLSTSIRFWLVILLGVMIALTRDYVFKVYKRNFNPEVHHLLQKHCSDSVDPLWNEEKDQKPKKMISEKLRTFGYAFSEADPACINVIRQQDKMI